MPELAYVNGEYLPIEDACISINDRGFLFGDSLYEVARLYDGRFFRLDEHLERMRRGATAIGLDVPFDRLREAMLELARRSGLKQAFVYAQVTRGVAPRGHAIPAGLSPTMVATVRPMDPMPEELYRQGVRAVTRPDLRWGRRDIKATTLLPNILDKTDAQKLGCYDAIHYEEDGTVTEGSVCNVLGVFDGVLRTHPTGHRILSGISRDAVLECATELGIDVDETPFLVEDIPAAEELFFSDTYCELINIVEVDGRPVGNGTPGPVGERLREAFRNLVKVETAPR